ncbi:aminoglycoside phosphotransferase family protein [Streptomyces sp. NBC_01186]|uniref:aminoglycoside phosphotransferase family protein n=1 Tax=Streptomyces sp. NBC_01186 TaxID=2903765 RepID=UPI002E0F125A|nr:aminoglycoside phosphotransferase family protein [Streptomyces sp. NBC_01186]
MVKSPYSDGRAGIDAELVERLIAAQFPRWSGLPVRPVEADGWDNRTYRLGEEMTVRLPTAEGYAPAVDKEDRWLPLLAPALPVPVPPVLAKGEPGEGYPFSWSVRGWLDGETARPERVDDLPGFAVRVAEFVLALQRVDATDGPRAGAHSFYRGAPPGHYDGETRRALAALEGRIDTARATAVWDAALASAWQGPPTWFHGDIAHGNLLVRDGELAAVLDFGTCGVGDPACDLVIAWTLFSGESREAFRAAVGQDGAMWARARGWGLWKALICLAEHLDTDAERTAEDRHVLDEILTDHDHFG